MRLKSGEQFLKVISIILFEKLLSSNELPN